jgi:zinc/manganese transport system substrate-binding protein
MIMILILMESIEFRIGPVAATFAAAVGALVLAACGGSDDGDSTTIAATTGITADIVERVAGPGTEVDQIVPDGASPHDFELSALDRQRLEEADLIVANGSGLEAGIPLDEIDAPTWELTEHAGELSPIEEAEGHDHGEEEEHAEGEEHEHEAGDPHVWMDPTRVANALPSLADALAEADPAGADDSRRRARKYASELRSLDRELAETLGAVPEPDRELVTSHDALGYLADRYGFEVIATAFPTTGAEAEASAEQIHDVEVAVRESGVPAVFAEESDDPEALELVAEETGVEVNTGLLVESPSAAGSYEGMLRRDADLIADSLRARR